MVERSLLNQDSPRDDNVARTYPIDVAASQLCEKVAHAPSPSRRPERYHGSIASQCPNGFSGALVWANQTSKLPSVGSGAMSALGHKRTFHVAVRESALPPKADMATAVQNVR